MAGSSSILSEPCGELRLAGVTNGHKDLWISKLLALSWVVIFPKFYSVKDLKDSG